MAYQLWDALARAKNLKWVDLTHPMDNESPYWSGIPEGSVELSKTVFDWGNPMLECLIQTFKFPGQFGTHIDFPGHFIRGAALSEGFGVEKGVWPLCVIDITDKASMSGQCFDQSVRSATKAPSGIGPYLASQARMSSAVTA